MELTIGNKIKYAFPQSICLKTKYFFGEIEFIGETFLTVRDKNKVILKISFKNFENVELIDEKENTHLSVSHPV